jgi:catechol-2,3-dioxygenase
MRVKTSGRLGHVAIAAHDPARVAEFYCDLLDLQVVRQNSNPLIGDAVLLSGDPAREDHELVFLTNAAARHIAFRVDTIEQLRAAHRHAKQRGFQIPYALDSGIAVGFFVRDPEGNAVEIYTTGNETYREAPPLSDPDQIDQLILG